MKIIKTCLKTGKFEVIKLTDSLIDEISKYNGYLTKPQVIQAFLNDDIEVHTSFSKYRVLKYFYIVTGFAKGVIATVDSVGKGLIILIDYSNADLGRDSLESIKRVLDENVEYSTKCKQFKIIRVIANAYDPISTTDFYLQRNNKGNDDDETNFRQK